MAKHGKLKKPRAAYSSYCRVEKPKKDRWRTTPPPLSGEERIKFALADYRAAVIRANANPDDVVLRIAVESRRNEWLDLKHAYARLAARREA